MTTKAHKIEMTVQEKDRAFDRERTKHEFSSPPPLSNFKRLKDRNFSVSRRDSQAVSFKQDGVGRQATLMASTGRSKVMRNLVCDHCGRNHRGQC